MRQIAILLLVAVLVGCTASSKTPDPAAQEATAATRLAAIPDADPVKYRGVSGTRTWLNPYLIIKTDGIGLLDVQNSEIHILKVDEVPETLAGLPATAWPYGRVVAIEEGGPVNSDDDKARLRANRGIVTGALEGMRVQIQWMPPVSAPRKK